MIEHVNRLSDEIAPDWPTAERAGTYRILFEGEPRFRCELSFGDRETFSDEGMIATTMRVVNAIPYVCEAEPGIVTAPELPLTLPRGVF